MKRIYVLVLIVFALFTAKAQDIAGFELGDNYLQYPNLSLEGSKGNFKKYNYYCCCNVNNVFKRTEYRKKN